MSVGYGPALCMLIAYTSLPVTYPEGALRITA